MPTPIRTFRCPDELWEEVVRVVRKRNDTTRLDQWEVSDFIKHAIRETLRKMERSRRSRRWPRGRWTIA